MLDKETTFVMTGDNKCQFALLTREIMDGSISRNLP